MATPIDCPDGCIFAGTPHEPGPDGMLMHERKFGDSVAVSIDELAGRYFVTVFVDGQNVTDSEDPAVELVQLAGECLRAAAYVAGLR